MTQLQMFDPRIAPTATAVMLEDRNLRLAIDRMRAGDDAGWPYVEALCEVEGRTAWLVDDGRRYVVCGSMIWMPEELWMTTRRLRETAREAIARLEEVSGKGEVA